jgi:adenylate kinase family enzyme
MNKGFILDGFPRSQEDAKIIFMEDEEAPKEEPAEADPEGAGEEPEEPKRILNQKIIPQYCIAMEADDAFLT